MCFACTPAGACKVADKGTIEVQVRFTQTDDPYFYDLRDRRPEKFTIFDELQWEYEVEKGLTDMSFEEWLRAKKEALSVASQLPWEDLCYHLHRPQ